MLYIRNWHHLIVEKRVTFRICQIERYSHCDPENCLRNLCLIREGSPIIPMLFTYSVLGGNLKPVLKMMYVAPNSFLKWNKERVRIDLKCLENRLLVTGTLKFFTFIQQRTIIFNAGSKETLKHVYAGQRQFKRLFFKLVIANL